MKTQIISRALAARWLPRRGRAAHKGSVGRVYFLGASRGMTGAAVLSAVGAVRGGAGLVRLGVPSGVADIVSTRARLEATVDALPQNLQGQIDGRKFSSIRNKIEKFDTTVLAAGPGLGVSKETRLAIEKALSWWPGPLVLDADGLNVIAPISQLRRKAPLVVTPHPGELGRLLSISTRAVQKDRLSSAKRGAQKCGGVCLLKGADTVITDGRTVFINKTGNPKMASGGMGDLLTGLIGALWGQMGPTLEQGFLAAALGAYLHGLAGDLAAKKIGGLSVTASDVASFIPAAVTIVRRS